MSVTRESYTSTQPLNEELRRKKIIDFISEHQGCRAEDVVEGVKNDIGRGKVFSILKSLKAESIVLTEKEKPNSREHKLFVDINNPLVIATKELDEFKKVFMVFLEQVRRHRDVYNGPDIDVLDRRLINAVRLFGKFVHCCTMRSILDWSPKIKDKDSLDKLFSIVYSRVSNMQIELAGIINPPLQASQLRMGFTGEDIYDFSRILRGSMMLGEYDLREIESYKRFGLENEVKPVIDYLSQFIRHLP